jgi:large repetitive protein
MPRPVRGTVLKMSALDDPTFDAPTGPPVNGEVTISGTSDAGVTIRIFVDGVLVKTISAQDNPTGHWTTTIPITPGPHSIRVEAGDGSVTKPVMIVMEASEDFSSSLAPATNGRKKSPAKRPRAKRAPKPR